MKKQFAKSALMMAAVLGAVSFNSCNEKPEVSLDKEVDVTIGVKMASRPGASLKSTSTADNVNMGATLNNIDNIVIVPFAGGNAGNSIVYGMYAETTDVAKYVTTTIPQATNMFRVYGNLPGTYSADKAFTFPSLALTQATDQKDASLTDVYSAHSLYYFVEAIGTTDENTTGFKVGTSETAGDWNTAATTASETVGENNRVAITKPLRYAVGALAAATIDGVTGDNLTKKIFKGATDADLKSWEEVKAEGADKITITGLIIEGQTFDFNERFEPLNDQEVKVYAGATTTALSTSKISQTQHANGELTGANIYSVVAPEDASSITVNFQFQNNTGYTLLLNDEDQDDTNNPEVADGGYFYLATTLEQDGNKPIFAAFTSTVLNATVLDWGKGRPNPVETTEVELGITVSMDWVEGITYDKEL